MCIKQKKNEQCICLGKFLETKNVSYGFYFEHYKKKYVKQKSYRGLTLKLKRQESHQRIQKIKTIDTEEAIL